MNLPMNGSVQFEHFFIVGNGIIIVSKLTRPHQGCVKLVYSL